MIMWIKGSSGFGESGVSFKIKMNRFIVHLARYFSVNEERFHTFMTKSANV